MAVKADETVRAMKEKYGDDLYKVVYRMARSGCTEEGVPRGVDEAEVRRIVEDLATRTLRTFFDAEFEGKTVLEHIKK